MKAVTDPKHLVCLHCSAINRVPGDRSAVSAQCRTCRQKLFDGHPAAVDTAGFDRHVAKNDIPVLVDVWAPWCGPCRSMAPEFEKASGMLAGDIRLLKVNADE